MVLPAALGDGWSHKPVSLLQMSQGNSEYEDSIVSLSHVRKQEVSLLVAGLTDRRVKQVQVVSSV